jgi:tetratricopeptide (TPR) repeat protein/KaiC/GvpD/RAD55 family RecA-like ATPase
MITEAVEAHHGTVVKGLGDGILATFESAADAVAGSIAVQQVVDTFGRRNPDRAFAVRVGISIGDVSAEQGDVFGVPVVEASRLCATAGGSEILVADLVRALARGRASTVFEPMGELALKGLQEPLAACRVVWEPVVERPADAGEATVPLPPALVGAAVSYVGRDALCERLRDEWTAVRAGASRTILLAGEPGVGKTRTAAELARQAFADGGLVLYGRCDEDLDVPYQTFVEALDHYARHSTAPVLGRLPGELTRLMPDLAAHAGQLPEPVHSDPASEEYRLFEATASWLIEAARAAGGLVLVLDDVHWATKPTLHLMLHVVRAAADEHAPLLVIATYRDTDVDRTHPLASVLADLRRLTGVERLTVENLSLGEVLELVETAARIELDEQIRLLATVMYAETEGNPFFVGEVLRHLIETGAVRREGERWVVAAADRITIPEGVRDVVGRRLSRLPAVANDVLSVAAVLGRDFDVELLLAVSDATENDALDALDQAVRARLVEETGVDHYRFAHALVRTTLYDELSATRRRRLHRRIADALEKLRPNDLHALAHHCVEAGPDGGDVGRALHYTLAAAEQSLAARAFGDAEEGFRSALELLDDGEHVDAPERVAALRGLGRAQRDQGNPAFRETLLEASRLALALQRTDALYEAVLANTRGFPSVIGGVDEDRIAYIEKALDLVGPEQSPTRARLLAMLASELTFTPDTARMRHTADSAIAMARALGDVELLSHVLTMTPYAHSNGVDAPSAVTLFDEAVRTSDEIGDPSRRAVARTFLGATLFAVGEHSASRRILDEALQIARAECPPVIEWTVRSNEIRNAALAGRLDEADALNAAMLTRGQELGQSDAEEWWAATALGMLWLRGYGGAFADEAAAYVERYPLAIVWKTAQIWLLAAAGRAADARARLAAAHIDADALLIQPWPYIPTAQLVLTAWEIDDADLAARMRESLLPYRGGWAHYFLFAMGPVSWLLGLSAVTAGDVDEGIALLEESLADLVQREYPALAAMVGFNLGQALLRRGRQPDVERARDVLAAARERAGAVGAAGLVERIDALR